MMAALMEFETIDADQINDIMAETWYRGTPTKAYAEGKADPPRDTGGSTGPELNARFHNLRLKT
jgi:hypothetical protein